jgi:hypothetical protein
MSSAAKVALASVVFFIHFQGKKKAAAALAKGR